MLSHRSTRSRGTARRRRPRRRLPLLAGLLTALLGLVALVGSALAVTAPGTPAAAQPPATPNPDCTLRVPAAPLTAAGLASPYQLTATDAANGPCHEADPAQSAFVQATVLDPATGAVSVYDPLVVDRGTRPARAPVVPKLPAHAVVGIWFGFNGTNLTLRGNTTAGRCVNGTGGSVFGQFAYCNAPAFFSAARGAERTGRLKVPPLGVGRDGAPCPTTRDFGIVDQDQSDNVTTAYLATPGGRTAQRTAAATRALGPQGAVALLNGSDNLLLTAFVDPALGCTPWTAPDQADPGHSATSLALDELQAAADQAAPVALVPRNDPMVLGAGGRQSRTKTDLYRVGVDQPGLGRGTGTDPGDGPTYCTRLAAGAATRLAADAQLFTASPSPTAGQNLQDFLSQRLTASLQNLGCPQAAAPSTSASPSGGATGAPTAPGMPSGTPTVSSSASGAGAAPSDPATGMASASGAASVPATAPGGGTNSASPKSVPPVGAGTPAAQAAGGAGDPVGSAVAGSGAGGRTGPAPVGQASGGAGAPTFVPVGDVVPSPVPVGEGATASASAGTGMIGTATMVAAPSAKATPTHGRLADTGASPRLWPYAGLALSLLLLGCAARLLAAGGRRH
ncbi:hypothetical protein [Streptacidiphilus jiangxiensis]|uniref:Uncharacterized protein n=1 Tax=Streptacidiphilus jiangxiensis TaxID=235985 RepID=A0A1H7ZV72_STRJI|nr:hypothetical protein [Streptacidiphilus jiangxiensis]SEM61399.1 hypothetical protein SAMN05414137_13739 [Streptacidiphilus jiangxiensis]